MRMSGVTLSKALTMVAAAAVFAAQAQALPVASEWAHEELTNHLEMILSKGTEGAVRLPRFEMVLPGDAGSKAFADDFAALRDTDGYAVRRRGDAICFVADNPKGHVNGVHRWLERNFDIIWPRPRDGMCFFGGADAAALAAADCDYRDLPAFRIRYLGGTHDMTTWKWKVRNADSGMFDCSTKNAVKLAVAEKYGMYGAFGDMVGGGHDMERRWFPRSEFFKDHPEYWMLVDGRRFEGKGSNFCETNPGFVEAFSRSVEEKIRDLPKSVRTVSINMEDQGLTCQCDRCLAPITLEDGTVIDKNDPAFKSTRFFIFFNQVARHIAKVRPGLRLLQFAYMHLSVPPKVKVEDNVTLKLCPYPRNMRYGIVEGPANAKWKERLDGWLANTKHIYLREYYFCGCIFYPRPIADSAAVDLRYCRDRGVDAVYTDLAGRYDDVVNNATYDLNRPYREFYDMVGMEAWTIGKLFWDPSLDPEALRAKYIALSFGPAAAGVAEFYRLLRESWYSDSAASGFSDNPFRSAAHYIVEKGIADKCRAALAAAASNADCRERREWIADMRRILEDWIREAPGFISGAFRVPRLAPGNPGLDFGDGAWAAAAQMPPFKILRGGKAEDRSGSCAKIYSDGSAFWIGFDVRTTKAPRAIPLASKGGFPRGDKIEVSFSPEGKEYFQFVFDCDGNRFEAKALDAKWKCKWDLFTSKGSNGWKAAVRIPFDAIGFAPAVNPDIKFLPVVTVGDYGKTGGQQLFSWKGGLPHSPASWGVLSVASTRKSSAGNAAPAVTWSIMHPVVVEPDYMRRVVDKAAEYGGVDSFEICGECNQPHGGLNGLLAYEPYPKTAAAVDLRAVETYRRKLRETVDVAHGAGKRVYFWHREGFMPKTMHEDVPGLLDEDGEYDLLGKPYLDYVRWKVREAFRQVPELDGVVLTLTEADFSVIHNSRPDRYPPAKVVETITRIFLEEHRRLGKRFVFRSFGSIESDYRDLIAGANACANDYDFEIETKITPFDFSPFLGANPYLKKTSRCTIGAECDCLGEYLGAGYLPAAQVDAIARYVGYGRAANVDRYTIRIDRVGNSIFDSAQEVNLYAYMRFIRDPKATAEDVIGEWAAKCWPKCADEMKELAKKSFDLVASAQFIDRNVCFHQNPPTPSFKFIKFSGILGVFRDGMDLHMTEPMWGMMSAQKTPGRAAIRAEKARAEKLAAEGLAKIESLRGRLDPEEYARQHRAWSIAAKAVPAMRAFWDCVAAYFDDMEAGDSAATHLAAAIDAAEKTILPRMKSTKIDLSEFNLNACRARGEDLDKVYFVTFLWLSRELMNEYRAESAARAKFKARPEVIDFVVPGGIYDDVRVRRVMHSSYQTIDGGVPVRFVGNAAFPNGTITVEFKEVPGAKVEVDADPRYAKDFAVTEKVADGIRTVTISKKGASYPGIRSIALIGAK